MNIEIRKLIPSLAEEYAYFFDTTHHWGSDDTKCYCITWCGDNVYDNGGKHWFDSPDERRVNAIRRVRDGDIQGYLAYYNDEIVGWCNANTKSSCKACMNYLRSEANIPLDECNGSDKIKFIFCFTIAPKVQRKGVATQLLEYVCQDAAADGFDYVEAHSKYEFSSLSNSFRGHLSMYEKCGFIKHAERDGKVVVRKVLEK